MPGHVSQIGIAPVASEGRHAQDGRDGWATARSAFQRCSTGNRAQFLNLARRDSVYIRTKLNRHEQTAMKTTASDAKPRFPTAPARSRHLPTGVLLLAVVSFPLPWIKLSCGAHPPGKARTEEFAITQSGLQASYGAVSLHAGKMGESDPQLLESKRKPEEAAPLLIVYGVAISLGLAAGLFVRAGKTRLAAMAACSLIALTVLVIQLRLGFPLFREMEPLPSYQLDPVSHLDVERQYTPWLWLSLAATAAAPFAVLIAQRAEPRPDDSVLVIDDDGPAK
jgi:hypothetical protein